MPLLPLQSETPLQKDSPGQYFPKRNQSKNIRESSNLLKIEKYQWKHYIKKEIATGNYPEYKAVGMGYIRFAKEEKQLFKFLLMNDGMKQTGLENQSFDESVFIIVKNYGLYKDEASKLHLQMWVFVHGIASMFATDYIDWDWETVSLMVTDAYKGFIKNIKGENA